MKSITIHGIENPLWSILKAKSESEGLSLNRTIKKLLEVSLGIIPKSTKKRKKEFQEFCGVWSNSDLHEFNESTKEFEHIDKEDWE